MPRGGYREGAGGKPKWKSGKTKVVRVPEALANEVIEYARKLDNLTNESVTTDLTNVGVSKILNLVGVSTYSFEKGAGVYLADLISRGYQIKPDALHNSIKDKARIKKQIRTNQLKADIDSIIKDLK